MAFPKPYAEIAARARVPAGLAVAAASLILAKPVWSSLAAGAGIAGIGLILRAWAAGHLEKNRQLATSGPFAHVRNPLYIGSLFVGLGFSVAANSAGVLIFVSAFFVLFYLPVVQEEESHLDDLFPEYEQYKTRVPRLWPRLSPAYREGTGFCWKLYAQNREYEALAGFIVAFGMLAGKILLLQ